DRIVLACGPPDSSAAAAAAAGRLASALESSLAIVHVVEDAHPAGWSVYDATRQAAEMAVAAAGEDLDIEFVERRGRTVDELTAAPADLDAAFVVVGGATRSAWQR